MDDRKQHNSTLRPRSLRRQREIAAGTWKPKPRKAIVTKRSTLKKKRKPIRKRAALKPGQESQVAFFRGIWKERPHVSEISGLPLIPMPDDWTDEAHVRAWLAQFSHVLPKGAYRRFKDRKDNILLKTGQEHEFWEKNKGHAREAFFLTPHHKRIGTMIGWVRCDDLYHRLRDEANGVQ